MSAIVTKPCVELGRTDEGDAQKLRLRAEQALRIHAPPRRTALRTPSDERSCPARRDRVEPQRAAHWKTDLPMTDNGRRLVSRLEPILAKTTFALVLTSPLRRARETCELAGLGEHAQVDPNLVEWDYGEYEGLTSDRSRRAPGCGCSSVTVARAARSPRKWAPVVDDCYRTAPTRFRWMWLCLARTVTCSESLAAPGWSSGRGRQPTFVLDTATVSILSHYRGVRVPSSVRTRPRRTRPRQRAVEASAPSTARGRVGRGLEPVDRDRHDMFGAGLFGAR